MTSRETGGPIIPILALIETRPMITTGDSATASSIVVTTKRHSKADTTRNAAPGTLAAMTPAITTEITATTTPTITPEGLAANGTATAPTAGRTSFDRQP